MTAPTLTERIQASTSAEREIDALVWCAFHDAEPTGVSGSFMRWSEVDGQYELENAPPLTDHPIGVGHCLQLMSEVLPVPDGWHTETPQGEANGWKIGIYRGLTPACGWSVMLRRHGEETEDSVHTLLTHALLLAILSAKGVGQ